MEQGLILTVLGMSWVFIFLMFLIIFTSLSSGIIRKFFPEVEKIDNKPAQNELEKIAAAIVLSRHYKRGVHEKRS